MVRPRALHRRANIGLRTPTEPRADRLGNWVTEENRIKNFRINQSLLTALNAVDAVGNVSEVTGSSVWRVPSIRTHDFLLASASDAI